jgi:hypothetical protein
MPKPTLAGPVDLTPEDAPVAALLHRAGKFLVFVRAVGAELFDEVFPEGVGDFLAPFLPRGALVKFRERMIAHDTDRKLLDRTSLSPPTACQLRMCNRSVDGT